jgi:hypothetical protein
LKTGNVWYLDAHCIYSFWYEIKSVNIDNIGP